MIPLIMIGVWYWINRIDIGAGVVNFFNSSGLVWTYFFLLISVTLAGEGIELAGRW